jgi:transposase
MEFASAKGVMRFLWAHKLLPCPRRRGRKPIDRRRVLNAILYWSAAVASSGCCPAAFRRGAPCTASFGNGDGKGCGNVFTWVAETFGWVLRTVLRPVGVPGFVVLPKRWIVERTFAWLRRYRRNSRDYEQTTESSEAILQLSMINLMSRRLARLKK